MLFFRGTSLPKEELPFEVKLSWIKATQTGNSSETKASREAKIPFRGAHQRTMTSRMVEVEGPEKNPRNFIILPKT